MVNASRLHLLSEHAYHPHNAIFHLLFLFSLYSIAIFFVFWWSYSLWITYLIRKVYFCCYIFRMLPSWFPSHVWAYLSNILLHSHGSQHGFNPLFLLKIMIDYTAKTVIFKWSSGGLILISFLLALGTKLYEHLLVTSYIFRPKIHVSE